MGIPKRLIAPSESTDNAKLADAVGVVSKLISKDVAVTPLSQKRVTPLEAVIKFMLKSAIDGVTDIFVTHSDLVRFVTEGKGKSKPKKFAQPYFIILSFIISIHLRFNV